LIEDPIYKQARPVSKQSPQLNPGGKSGEGSGEGSGEKSGQGSGEELSPEEMKVNFTAQDISFP